MKSPEDFRFEEDEYLVIVGGSLQRPFIGTHGARDWKHVITNLRPAASYKIKLSLKAVMVSTVFFQDLTTSAKVKHLTEHVQYSNFGQNPGGLKHCAFCLMPDLSLISLSDYNKL